MINLGQLDTLSKKDGFMDTYQFTVMIERQPDGEYLVSVPTLPGCYTEGRTLEEAREMATDAIRAYYASLIEHGEPIPVESPEEQFIGSRVVVPWHSRDLDRGLALREQSETAGPTRRPPALSRVLKHPADTEKPVGNGLRRAWL